jgi:hypothetical protein
MLGVDEDDRFTLSVILGVDEDDRFTLSVMLGVDEDDRFTLSVMLGVDEDDGSAELVALVVLVPELCHHLPHLHHHHGGARHNLIQLRLASAEIVRQKRGKKM